MRPTTFVSLSQVSRCQQSQSHWVMKSFFTSAGRWLMPTMPSPCFRPRFPTLISIFPVSSIPPPSGMYSWHSSTTSRKGFFMRFSFANSCLTTSKRSSLAVSSSR